jgi:hypothetical protein
VWALLSATSAVVLSSLWTAQLCAKHHGGLRRRFVLIRRCVCTTGILGSLCLLNWTLKSLLCLNPDLSKFLSLRVLEIMMADIVTAVLHAHLLAMTYTVFFAMYGSASRLVPISVSVGMPLLVFLTFLLVFGVDLAVLGLDRVWPRALFFWWQLAAFWAGIIVCWSILRKVYSILHAAPVNSQLPNQGPRVLFGVLAACTMLALLASYPMSIAGKKLFDDPTARLTELPDFIDPQAILFSGLHVSCLTLSIWWNWRPIFVGPQTTCFGCCLPAPKQPRHDSLTEPLTDSLTDSESFPASRTAGMSISSQYIPSFSQLVDEKLETMDDNGW